MYKKSRSLRRIRENLNSGGGLHTSCEAAGISYITLWTWRKKWRRIDNYICRILESRVQLVEDALYKGALKGNTTAQIFYLKNRGSGWSDGPLIDQSNHTHITKVIIERYDPSNRIKNAGLSTSPKAR